jgi:hypothetical protein
MKKPNERMRVNSSKRLEYISQQENKLKNKIIPDKLGTFSVNIIILKYRSGLMCHVLRVEKGLIPKMFNLQTRGYKHQDGGTGRA